MDSLNNINLNGNKITKAGGITGGDASSSKVFYADGSIKSPLSNVVSGISKIYRDKWARVVKFGDSSLGTYIITIQYGYFNTVKNESFFVSFNIYDQQPTIIQLNSSQYNPIRNLKLRVLSPWNIPSAGCYLDIWFTDRDYVYYPNNPAAVNPEKEISVSILLLGYYTKIPQINTTFEEAEDLDESSNVLTYKGVNYRQYTLTTDVSFKSLMKAEMFVADEFKGDLTGTANKATGDSNGNNIVSTYIKNLQIANKTLTATKGDDVTVDIGTIPTNYTAEQLTDYTEDNANSGVTAAAVKKAIKEVFKADANNYGSVKIGNNLSIGSDGKLNAKDTTYGLAVASEDGGNDTGSAGLMSPADKYNLDKLVDNGQYVLPIASSSKLGGIKVGSNLSINSSTGVLSATNTTYSQGNSDTLGLTRLYTSTGSNTNGTMTQKAVTNLITPLQNITAAAIIVKEITVNDITDRVAGDIINNRNNLAFNTFSSLTDYSIILPTLVAKLVSSSYAGLGVGREITYNIIYTPTTGAKFSIRTHLQIYSVPVNKGDVISLRLMYLDKKTSPLGDSIVLYSMVNVNSNNNGVLSVWSK